MGASVYENKQAEELEKAGPLLNLTIDEIKAFYKTYRSVCEGYSINMTEYVQIYQPRGEISLSQAEITFSIFATEKTALIDALEFFAGITLQSSAPYNEKIEMMMKLFDFNSIGSISAMDLEYLLACCVSSIFKIRGIKDPVNYEALAGLAYSVFKQDSQITEKEFAKFCYNSSIILFLKYFHIPESNKVHLEKRKNAVHVLSRSNTEYTFYRNNCSSAFNCMSSKRYSIYRKWLKKVILPNLRKQAISLGYNKSAHKYAVNLTLKWAYGINHYTQPILQFLNKKDRKKNNDSHVVYSLGSMVIVYNAEAYQQHYYFGHHNQVDAVAISKNAEHIASAEVYRGRAIVHIWNSSTWINESVIFTNQCAPIRAMEFIQNDEYLIALGSRRPYAFLLYHVFDSAHSPIKLLEYSSTLDDLPIRIERIPKVAGFRAAIFTRSNVVEIHLNEQGLLKPISRCPISSLDPPKEITCGTLWIAERHEKYSSHHDSSHSAQVNSLHSELIWFTGHNDGNVTQWERSGAKHLGLIDYKSKIVSISELSGYLAIVTAIGRIYLWDVKMLDTRCVKEINISSPSLLKIPIISSIIVDFQCSKRGALVVTRNDALLLEVTKDSLSVFISVLEQVSNLVDNWPKCLAVIDTPKQRMVAIGGDSGFLSMIDMKSNVHSYALDVKHPISAIDSFTRKFILQRKAQDPIEVQETLIVVGTSDGKMIGAKIINDEKIEPLSEKAFNYIEEEADGILDIKFSPNGAALIALDSQHNCYFFEWKCESIYEFRIVKKFEKEGPSFPVSLAFSSDSSFFVAFSNRTTIFSVDIKGLSLKNSSLSELQETSWVNVCSKYYFRTKSEQTFTPFSTARSKPILFTADNGGNIFAWRDEDDTEIYFCNNYHIHSCPIEYLALSSSDKYLVSLGGRERAICQWEVRVQEGEGPRSNEITRLSVVDVYQNGSPSLSEHQIRELQYCYSVKSEMIKHKEEISDRSALIKGSRAKLLNHILTTGKGKYQESMISKPAIGIINLQHITGMSSCYRRGLLKYLRLLPTKIEYKEEKKKPIGFLNKSRTDEGDRRSEKKSFTEIYEEEDIKEIKKYIVYIASKYVVIEEQEKGSYEQSFYQRHKQKVTTFCIHPLLNIIASGDDAGYVHIWNWETKEQIKIFQTPHETGIAFLHFSPKGSRLLSLGSGKQGLWVVDWESERELAFLYLNAAPIFDIKFIPTSDFSMVAIGLELILELDLDNNLETGQPGISTTNVLWPGVASSSTSLLCMDFLEQSLGGGQPFSDCYIGTSQGDIGILIDHQFEILTKVPIHEGAINCIKIIHPFCIITAGDDNFIKMTELNMRQVLSFSIGSLSLYKMAIFGDLVAIPPSHIHGIHSLEVFSPPTLDSYKMETEMSILVGLRCGDSLELQLEIKESPKEYEGEFGSTPESIKGKIYQISPEFKIIKRVHCSLGRDVDERKLCVAAYPGPEYPLLISSGFDCTLRFWNIQADSLDRIEDLGIRTNTKIACLEFSPDGSRLVMGMFTGKLLIYSFKIEDAPTENFNTIPPVNLSLIQHIHDSQGTIIAMKFSENGNFLAVSHNKGPKEEEIKGNKSPYVVFLYQKIGGVGEEYHMFKQISIYIAPSTTSAKKTEESLVERSVVQMDFSKNNKFLQLCYLPVNKNGKILFQYEPMSIVWDLAKEGVVEDWDQLVGVQWSGIAFAPSLNVRYLNLLLKARSIEEDTEMRPKEQVTLSSCQLFDVAETDLVCSGSATGDLHLFRFGALFLRKTELTSSTPFEKTADKKSNMALCRSYNACASYIDMLKVIPMENANVVIAGGFSDEVILRYSLFFEDRQWDLDYFSIESPIPLLSDPFQELPTEEKFRLLLNEKWNPRSVVASIKQKAMATADFIDLNINWIFGRRSFDRRNNVKYDFAQRVVYFSGSMLLIAYFDKEHSKKMVQKALPSTRSDETYREISCLAIGTLRNLVALGTAESQAHIFVWDISTEAEIANIELENVSIVYCLRIHSSDRFLAGIGITQEFRQIIFIVDILEQRVISRATQLHSIPYKIRDIEFIPGKSYAQFVTCGVQHMAFWNISGYYIESQHAEMNVPKEDEVVLGEDEERKSETFKDGPFLFCQFTEQKLMMSEEFTPAYVSFLAVGFIRNTMLTVGDDGQLYLWEGERIIRRRPGHTGPILCMDISTRDRLVATGGVDGKAVLWVLNLASGPAIDLEKIRSIQIDTVLYRSPIQTIGVDKGKGENAIRIQSVCLDRGSLLIGTRTGSIYEVTIADSKGYVNPNDVSHIRQFIDGFDDEIPQAIGHDQLQNRLCCLSKKGNFAVLDIDTKLLIHSHFFSCPGKSIHIFRISGDILLGFADQLVMLSSKYVEGEKIMRKNITAVKVSNNESVIVVASGEGGAYILTAYNIESSSNKMYINQGLPARGFRSAVISLDFTIDDNYLFAADELGEIYIFDSLSLVEIKKDHKLEVELEWNSTGMRADKYFSNIAKFYSHTNKISTITRIPLSSSSQRQEASSILAIGDQIGTLRLYKYPLNYSEFYSVCKCEHLNWISECLCNRDASTLWSVSEGDHSIIKWSIRRARPLNVPRSKITGKL